MKKIFVLFLTILLIPTNAQAFGINKTMKTIMSSWNGESINSVIRRWGYPTNQRTVAGRTLYYWDWVYTVGTPVYTNATANTYGDTIHINSYSYGGGTRHVWCNRILEVDDLGRVASWDWNGNNCPYTKVRLYKQWVNPKVLNEAAYQNKSNKQNRKINKLNKSCANEAEYNRTIEITRKFIDSLKENQNR